MAHTVQQKLEILADAAKYDASCASSGAKRAGNGQGIGHSDGTGICHSYTPDGRCVSLLKILLTNFCTYDCAFCVNRVSSDIQRARFTPDEVVNLTLDFYKRNYIEGLFLSSGIIQSPDYTMEQLVAGRENPAARPPLRRLHSPEDDPRLRRAPDHCGRHLCRPPQCQHRTSHTDRSRPTCSGKEIRRSSRRPWTRSTPASSPTMTSASPSARHQSSLPPGNLPRWLWVPRPPPTARSSRAPARSTAASSYAASTTPASARTPRPIRACHSPPRP